MASSNSNPHLRVRSDVPVFICTTPFSDGSETWLPLTSRYVFICPIPLHLANFLTRTGLPPCSVALLTWALTSARPLLSTAMPNGFLTELLRTGGGKAGKEGATHYIRSRSRRLLCIPLCVRSKFRKAQRVRTGRELSFL